jgi:thiol-disulfide isomerase/thioredoxin
VSNKPSRPSKQPSASRSAAAAGSGSKSAWIIGGVVVAVVAIAAIVAIVVSSSSDDTTTASGGEVVTEDYGEVSLASVGLTELPSGGEDPAVGSTIPEISGAGFDGQPITISPDGTPKVIVFLAHWCPHCQTEVPRIQSWIDANGMPDDVEVISVPTATDKTRPNFSPAEWLNGEGWQVPVLVDNEEQTAAKAFGLSGFPFFVVVDADGNVVQRTSGEIDVAQWESLLDAARTGTAGAVGETGPASAG